MKVALIKDSFRRWKKHYCHNKWLLSTHNEGSRKTTICFLKKLRHSSSERVFIKSVPDSFCQQNWDAIWRPTNASSLTQKKRPLHVTTKLLLLLLLLILFPTTVSGITHKKLFAVFTIGQKILNFMIEEGNFFVCRLVTYKKAQFWCYYSWYIILKLYRQFA